jgi:hypothetical protein
MLGRQGSLAGSAGRVRATILTLSFPIPTIHSHAVAVAQPGILLGEAVVESMLRSNPSINDVLCSNSRDTVGAAQVISDFNLGRDRPARRRG